VNWQKKIRGYLKDRHLSHGWLADELGVSKAAVGHWLTGKRGIKLEHAKRLSATCGVPLHEILDSDDPGILTAEETAFIHRLRQLPQEQRKALLTLMSTPPPEFGQ
jgi:predicted transcriptional regulator